MSEASDPCVAACRPAERCRHGSAWSSCERRGPGVQGSHSAAVQYIITVNTSAPTCALCGQAVGGGEPARAVRDKFVCGECRRLVLATEPAPVLSYADRTVRKRRWLWPAVAAAALALAIAASLLLASQRVAMAHKISGVLVTSMSSSTITVMRPM